MYIGSNKLKNKLFYSRFGSNSLRKNPNVLYQWTGGAPIGILPVHSLNPIYVDSRCSNRGHPLFTIIM